MTQLIPNSDLRREADFRRLKTRHPICLLCGYCRHPAAIEFAHVIPRKFGVGCGGPLCSNCHRETSDKEKDMSYQPISNEPDLETIGRFLHAYAEWQRRSSDTFDAFAVYLLDQVRNTPIPKGYCNDTDT